MRVSIELTRTTGPILRSAQDDGRPGTTPSSPLLYPPARDGAFKP